MQHQQPDNTGRAGPQQQISVCFHNDVVGLLDFLKLILEHRTRAKMKVTTQNVMVSECGADTQEIHCDDSWDGMPVKGRPRPRYYTILVALTKQDEYTGCTEVWPGTHCDRSLFNAASLSQSVVSATITGVRQFGEAVINVQMVFLPQSKKPGEAHEPGDIMIFDGLLAHRGTANKAFLRPAAAINKCNTIDRYFFYMAVSTVVRPYPRR